MKLAEVIKALKPQRQLDYSEGGIRRRVIHWESLHEIKRIILYFLAVSEIAIIFIGLYPLVMYCHEQYQEAVGAYKVMWSYLPTFALLNGLFLASLTAWRAVKDRLRESSAYSEEVGEYRDELFADPPYCGRRKRCQPEVPYDFPATRVE